MRHLAYCDSCKKDIFGIRYKCSICPDFDLCEICEEKNLLEKFHPENHFFLKVNKPVGNAQLRSCARNIHTLLKEQQQQPAPNPQLEERVEAAESRLQSLESKMRDLALKPKNRKALKKMILEEQAKTKAQTCERRKKQVQIKTPSEQQQEEVAEKKEEALAMTSCQPIAGSFLELSLERAAVALPDLLPNEMIFGTLVEEPQPEPIIAETIPTDKQMPLSQLQYEPELEPELEPEPEPAPEVAPTPIVCEEPAVEDTEYVKQLVTMGFDRNLVLNVVAAFPDDLEDALEHLLF